MDEQFKGLSLPRLMEKIEQPPPPPAISMWPQTSGWLVVLALVLLVAVYFAKRLLERQKRNAYRRSALRALQRMQAEPAALNRLLKKTALHAFPREEVARLSGDAWLQFLEASAPDLEFSIGPGRVFAHDIYRTAVSDEQLRLLVSKWIKTHKPLQRRMHV
ncbi:DUF4381 domain-containing protein [Polycladidibacter hongkongensis]|uniref:DUF4381 domain-containing protein n=1 Tax=Polycladidibacter hongkongensis TaxID=1647556 RepID=UPI00082A1BD0|nr:DUF4381 domain-containing protein [Pseudovibrio hongkongensis]